MMKNPFHLYYKILGEKALKALEMKEKDGRYKKTRNVFTQLLANSGKSLSDSNKLNLNRRQAKGKYWESDQVFF